MEALTIESLGIQRKQIEVFDAAVVDTVMPEQIAKILVTSKALRTTDKTFYLRQASSNIFSDMISVTFSCDGAHYRRYDMFLEKSIALLVWECHGLNVQADISISANGRFLQGKPGHLVAPVLLACDNSTSKALITSHPAWPGATLYQPNRLYTLYSRPSIPFFNRPSTGESPNQTDSRAR